MRYDEALHKATMPGVRMHDARVRMHDDLASVLFCEW